MFETQKKNLKNVIAGSHFTNDSIKAILFFVDGITGQLFIDI